MKKFLVLLLAVGAASSVATATTACGTTNYTLAALTTLGSCETGDKIFSNFGGNMDSVDTFTTVTFTGSNLGPYTVQLSDSNNAALETSFTFSYTISVDPTIIVPGGFNYIAAMAAGGVDTFGGVAANNNLTNNAGCSPLNSADSPTGFVSQSCLTTGQPTSLSVAESYVYTSGFTATSIQDSYQQAFQSTSGTPEPGSMILLGSGLLAAGLIGRKKLVRK